MNTRLSHPAIPDKWQPTSVKLELLRGYAIDQAIQCERAGLAADASEWRELSERVKGLSK